MNECHKCLPNHNNSLIIVVIIVIIATVRDKGVVLWLGTEVTTPSALTSGSLGIWISLLKYIMSLALLKKVLRLRGKEAEHHPPH